jgi:predicted SnoaL-like aldol condensation-catalyzing enzyme
MRRFLSFWTFLLLIHAATAHAESREQRNKNIVVGFYTKAFVDKEPRKAAEAYISESVYIQHNPHVADGRKAFIDFFEPYFASHPELLPSEIKRVMADGDLVMLHVHSRRTLSDRGYAVVDIFRVDGDKIVEHWDVMQPVPESTVSGHPVF